MAAQDAALTWADKAAAVFLGLGVTTVAFGKAVIGVWLFLAAIVVLFRFVKGRSLARMSADLGKSLGLAIVVTLAWWLVCSVLSIDPGKAISTWARTAGLIFLAYCIVAFLRRDDRLVDICLKSILLSATLTFGYLFLIGYVDLGFIGLMEWVKGRPLDATLFAKHFRSVAACLLPVLVWSGFRLHGGWRLLAVLACLFAGLTLYAGDAQMSRSAVAGVFGAGGLVVVVMMLWPLPSVVRRAVLALGVVVVSVGGIVFLGQLPRPPMDGQELVRVMPLPDAHRQVIWGYAHDEVKKRPLFGTGMNTINRTAESKLRHRPYRWGADENGNIRKDVLDLEYLPAHPHNWVLEVAAENGVPGLVLMLAAVVMMGARFVRAAYARNAAAWAALSVIATFFIGSLANFSFWSVWWQASFLVLLAVTWAATALSEDSARSTA